jgi:hypothetical protein
MFLVMFDEDWRQGEFIHSDLPSTSTASNEMEVDVTVDAGDLADEVSFFEPTIPQEDGE